LGVDLPIIEIKPGIKSVKRIPFSKVVDLSKVEEFKTHGIWNNHKEIIKPVS